MSAPEIVANIARPDLFAVYYGDRYLPVIGIGSDGIAVVLKEDGTAKRCTSVHGFERVISR